MNENIKFEANLCSKHEFDENLFFHNEHSQTLDFVRIRFSNTCTRRQISETCENENTYETSIFSKLVFHMKISNLNK